MAHPSCTIDKKLWDEGNLSGRSFQGAPVLNIIIFHLIHPEDLWYCVLWDFSLVLRTWLWALPWSIVRLSHTSKFYYIFIWLCLVCFEMASIEKVNAEFNVCAYLKKRLGTDWWQKIKWIDWSLKKKKKRLKTLWPWWRTATAVFFSKTIF